jgi:hypothetical protein
MNQPQPAHGANLHSGRPAGDRLWRSGHLLRHIPTLDCGDGDVPAENPLRTLWIGFLCV